VAEDLVLTADPAVLIEEQHPGYVRYRRSDGRRWEVFGACVFDGSGHGPCMEGAIDPDIGDPRFRLDVPVTPELQCSLCVAGRHLTFRELEPGC
jgi:hypothetical protein